MNKIEKINSILDSIDNLSKTPILTNGDKKFILSSVDKAIKIAKPYKIFKRFN